VNRDDLKWLVGIVIGLIIGIGTSYATFTTNDAVLETRISQLEACSRQYQSDINIMRVELSKVNTEIKNTDQSYKALRLTLKDVADSTKDVALALARLEERQAKTDEILKRLVK
jgi:septal ring factor EnvC (AmiA/AmiB activator)